LITVINGGPAAGWSPLTRAPAAVRPGDRLAIHDVKDLAAGWRPTSMEPAG
jgi:hypothetical protein